jgi:hypothetical protein
MPLSPYRFFSSLSFCRLSALITGCGFPLWGEPPWQGDQWAMVFEDGFRVNFVIVFVIVLLSFCVT